MSKGAVSAMCLSTFQRATSSPAGSVTSSSSSAKLQLSPSGDTAGGAE